MSLLEAAKRMTQELREEDYLTVPIKTLRVTVYAKPLPALTTSERQAIIDYRRKQTIEGQVEEIIARAIDDKGNKIYHPADRLEFKHHVSGDVVAEIWLAFLEADGAFSARMQEKYKTDNPEPISDVAALAKN